MTRFLHGLLVIAAAGEIALVAAAVLIRMRQAGLSLAEAGVYALVGTLMLLSLVLQVAFLAGYPRAALFCEMVILAAAAADLIRRWRLLAGEMPLLADFARRNLLLFYGLTGIAGLLLVLLVILPPLDGAGAVQAWNPIPAADTMNAYRSANHRVLVGFFNRLSEGSGLLGLIAYLVVALATYALARRYAWPPVAATVTLVVVSQPRVFYQALSPGDEILPAAVGLFCLLALYRTVEHPRFVDLILLVLGLSFAVAEQPLGAAFPVILALLGTVILYRRHGGAFWWWLVRKRPAASLAALAAALVFVQVWRWVPGAAAKSPPFHAPPNTDGILGTVANLVRYLLQSIDLMPAGEHLWHWVSGTNLEQTVEDLYLGLVAPLVGQSGAAAPFELAWGFDPVTAWFGPLGLVLVLPAVAYALLRGPRRLKAVAVAMAGYGYLGCLIPAWTPYNGAIFIRFFACGGFMIAFLLPPWRLRRPDMIGIQIFCLLLLCYAALGRWGWIIGGG